MVESDLEFLIFVVTFDLDNQASTVVELCLHGSEWSVGVRSLMSRLPSTVISLSTSPMKKPLPFRSIFIWIVPVPPACRKEEYVAKHLTKPHVFTAHFVNYVP